MPTSRKVHVPVPEDVEKAVHELRLACSDWQSEFYEGSEVVRTLESDLCFLVGRNAGLQTLVLVGVLAGVVIGFILGIFAIRHFQKRSKT